MHASWILFLMAELSASCAAGEQHRWGLTLQNQTSVFIQTQVSEHRLQIGVGCLIPQRLGDLTAFFLVDRHGDAFGNVVGGVRVVQSATEAMLQLTRGFGSVTTEKRRCSATSSVTFTLTRYWKKHPQFGLTAQLEGSTPGSSLKKRHFTYKKVPLLGSLSLHWTPRAGCRFFCVYTYTGGITLRFALKRAQSSRVRVDRQGLNARYISPLAKAWRKVTRVAPPASRMSKERGSVAVGVQDRYRWGARWAGSALTLRPPVNLVFKRVRFEKWDGAAFTMDAGNLSNIPRKTWIPFGLFRNGSIFAVRCAEARRYHLFCEPANSVAFAPSNVQCPQSSTEVLYTASLFYKSAAPCTLKFWDDVENRVVAEVTLGAYTPTSVRAFSRRVITPSRRRCVTSPPAQIPVPQSSRAPLRNMRLG